MSKIKLCNIVFMLVLLYCLFSPTATSAQVILTNEEAAALGHELTIARVSIDSSRMQVQKTKEQLQILLSDLEVQKRSLIEQQLQLEEANRSLKQLNEDHKKQVHRISRQRNFAYAVAAAFAVLAAIK